MVLGELSRRAHVEFHSDADAYLAAVGNLTPGVSAVPVLRPADHSVAELWNQVLREQFAGPRPPQPDARLVLCVAGPATGPATVLARLTGARLVLLTGFASVAAEVAVASERSVVVVAPAADLTVGRIIDVARACDDAGRTWGVLTGRGLPELAFAVAKAVLRPSAGLTGGTVVDAPSHRMDENRPLTAELTEPGLFTLIRSHGEGGHAKLPGTVVCGLVDDVEFPDHPDVGCSRRDRRCKRAPADATVLFAGEVRAPVVAFVCCNGFNVAGELYPSPVSMALGMAEGWVGALIAPVRPLVAPDSMVARMRELMHAGVPYGEVVRQLNELSGRLGQPYAFVLHGDPLARLDPVVAGAVETGGGPDEAVADQEWTLRALAQTERGARLLRSIRAWLGENTPAEVAELDARLAKAARSLLNALKWAESLPTAASVSAQARTRFLTGSLISAWDRAMCSLLLEAREIFDAYDAGHYDQRLVRVGPGDPCARCGTPTEVAVFGGGGRGADDERRAEACVICGPISEGRAAGLRLMVIESTREGRAGDRYVLRVRISPPQAGPVARGVHLRMRFFDKAAGGCVADQTLSVPVTEEEVEFGFDLPEGLGVDLHSVRVVAVSGYDVAYARARFIGLPGR